MDISPHFRVSQDGCQGREEVWSQDGGGESHLGALSVQAVPEVSGQKEQRGWRGSSVSVHQPNLYQVRAYPHQVRWCKGVWMPQVQPICCHGIGKVLRV